ncbi:MAG: nuclear transport factor 2 family protein [Rhizomicrobium sp.]
MNDDKLNKLYGIIEVQTLKARYCEASDGIVKDRAKAAALLKELFTEDAIADYGMGELKGRDAVIDAALFAVLCIDASEFYVNTAFSAR